MGVALAVMYLRAGMLPDLVDFRLLQTDLVLFDRCRGVLLRRNVGVDWLCRDKSTFSTRGCLGLG